jgi:flagellar motor switch protein FliN
MNDNLLSQAEVDALLKKKEAAYETCLDNADEEALFAQQEKVQVQKPVFAQLENSPINGQKGNLDLIMDVPLEFSVVLGKTKKTIKDVLSLNPGSVVELNKLADEDLEIYVNGKLIAHGEVVVVNDNFGVRITHVLSREQRVKGLK